MPKQVMSLAVIFSKVSAVLGLAGVIAPAVLLAGSAAWGGEGSQSGREAGSDRAASLLKAVPVPKSVDNTTAGALYSFDISFVDNGVYYLADRSNKRVDVLIDKAGASVTQIAPNNGHGPFAGFTACVAPGHGANDCAGPNGVVANGRWLFVTDAPSRVLSFDLSQTPPKTVSEVTTKAGDPTRADELAYAPGPGLILAINNAANPPFGTLISVNKTTGALAVVKTIIFDLAHTGVNATNGAEQPVWDPGTGKFYLSIPEINGTGVPSTLNLHGAVLRISTAGKVEAQYPVTECGPAGLALGPKQDLLVGCQTVYDVNGVVWAPAGTVTAAPRDVIIDAKTGKLDKEVFGVGAGDEVWFNPGDGNYYATGSGSPFRPLPAATSQGSTPLGVIDAKDQSVLQQLTTFNVPAVTTGPIAGQHPASTAHSVAANDRTNHIFVPLGANNAFPNCTTGCIAVYGHPDEDAD